MTPTYVGVPPPEQLELCPVLVAQAERQALVEVNLTRLHFD